jgi:hypothetical protein
MLTVNKGSAIPGFGFTKIRGNLTSRGLKETQTDSDGQSPVLQFWSLRILLSDNMIPKFWRLLFLFWDKDRVLKWRHTIFPDPDVGAEGCFNLISLTSTVHDMWNRGLFALKPLKL